MAQMLSAELRAPIEVIRPGFVEEEKVLHRPSLSAADFRSTRCRYAGEGFRRGADDYALRSATPELEADLASTEVQRDPPEGLQDVGPEQQRRLVRKSEHL